MPLKILSLILLGLNFSLAHYTSKRGRNWFENVFDVSVNFFITSIKRKQLNKAL